MTPIIITNKIDFIAKTLKVVEDILKKRKESLVSEYLFFAAEKKTEEIIESAISINQEILKTYYQHVSNSYYESFMDLQRLEIFTEDELKILASTAGFRNRLAHEYLELNPEVTLKSMARILKVYPGYLKKMKKFVDQK